MPLRPRQFGLTAEVNELYARLRDKMRVPWFRADKITILAVCLVVLLLLVFFYFAITFKYFD